MSNAIQRVHDYMVAREDERVDVHDIAKATGLKLNTVRTCVYQLTVDNRFDVYHIAKNVYMYSLERQVTKKATRSHLITWWEKRKEMEITTGQVAKALNISNHFASRLLSELVDTLSCCYRVRFGVYIWDEECKHTYKSQADIVLDYLKEHNNAASMSQMERDLGITLPALCRLVKSIQAQPKLAKISKTTYVELLEDNRK
ncbi:hypothetical protein ABMA68_16305 [Halobacteriovorax sp. FRX-2]|uniref:hypothetical protein n=1 Tax=Halobacteriovorax sp. FRX-2 TaxID=3157711 RepID=UPI00371065D2